MLKIKDISKTYKTASFVQRALDNVSLNLRDNEFVAILGPSGSGKTTLLNIIGGLDHYDSGDLIINGISTKHYKDKDWDRYRNHTIGFVFQSYNLIPHQNILSNVELALTIAGESKKERKRKALEALEEVGLKDHAYKKPNQLSGGQMQRVAIARALVNNPDILLADEPTGALDSNTSIQVMDLLKEVAKDRLVVMVTHNPELADEYANRIVRLQDGKIISDSNPFEIDEKESDNKLKTAKSKMSFFTALALSFQNLLTKKGRTFLTAFAGSIGIIGIALIMSLSQGFQNYIDKIQEDTLSSYPLTITSETSNAASMILSMKEDTSEAEEGSYEVKENQFMAKMFSSIGTNDVASFKEYIEEHEDEISDDVTNIKYTYSITPNIYTVDVTGTLTKVNPSSMMSMLTSGTNASILTSIYSSNGYGIFTEYDDEDEDVKNDYEILAGRWPESYDEMILVLSSKNGISDLLAYSLGLKDTKELTKMITDVMSGIPLEETDESLTFTYQDFLDLDFRLILSSDTYSYNEKYGVYEDMSSSEEYMQELYDKALKLKIVAVVTSNDSSSTLSSGVCYSKKLTNYVINEAAKSQIVQSQINNPEINVFTGKSFDSEEETTSINFEDMISIDKEALQSAFKINTSGLNADDTAEIMQKYLTAMMANITMDTTSTENDIKEFISAVLYDSICEYINTYASGNKITFSTSNFDSFTTSYLNSASYQSVMKDFLSKYGMNEFSSEMSSTIGDSLSSLIKTSLYSCLLFGSNTDVDYVKTHAKSNISTVMDNVIVSAIVANVAPSLHEAKMKMLVANDCALLIQEIMSSITSMFNSDLFSIDTAKMASAFKFNMTQEDLTRLMSSLSSSSEVASARSNLIVLGYQDLEDPTSISFYFDTFEGKENFLDWLENYNEKVEESKEINYTDVTGLLMGSVKTIIDSVSYVLIAFVSISLVVSSVMIAVITLISVLERTKEIGILRAMGASKHNVSSIFNAETFIIGTLSGLLGIAITLMLNPVINYIIHDLTNNNDINAVLPLEGGIALILVSILLTVIAGLIPAKKASRQDVVIALRTE